MRTVALAVLAGVMIFGGLGCGDASLDREDWLLAKKPIQAKNPDPARQNMALGDKLQPYIKCLNTVFSRVDSSRSRYLSWIKDPKVGPTCKERYLYAPYALYGTSACTTELDKANQRTPKLDKLEAAATDVAKAIRTLEPLLKEANGYYTAKTYNGDSCAKGKALHPKLMAAFSLFGTARTAMSSEIRVHNRKVLYALLDSIEKKYGKTHPRYYHRKVSLDARAVLNLMGAQTFSKTAKPGMAKVRETVAQFGALVERMDSAPNKHTGGVTYTLFRSQAKRFLEACQEYVNKRATGPAKWTSMERRWLKKTSTSWMVKGSYGRVGRRFDELIRSSNRVKFR